MTIPPVIAIDEARGPLPIPLRFALFLLPLALAGCGASSATPSIPYPDVTGGWQFDMQLPTPPNFSSGIISQLSGALSSSGPTVTGVLRANSISPSPCVTVSTDIPVTGTIDKLGNLTLTAQISGGTATLYTSLYPLVHLPTGTLTVTGGACAQAAISLSAVQVPNVSGTYTGVLAQGLPSTNGTAPALPVTAVLVESLTADAHGVYALAGTVTTSGSCPVILQFTAGSVLGVRVSSSPAANGVLIIPVIPMNLFSASATPLTVSSLHEQLLANLNVPTGCSGFAYSGVLTSQ